MPGIVTPAVVVGGVSVAAYLDWRFQRIPNWLTYPMIGAGLLIGAVSGEFTTHLAGTMVALIPAALVFFLGSLGGGDVKLLAAIGALLGYPEIIDVLALAIALGAASAIVLIIVKGRLPDLLRGMRLLVISMAVPGSPKLVPVNDASLPFGIVIAAATFVALFVPASRLTVYLTDRSMLG